MAKRLLLVRHALPDGAPKGSFLGKTDLPISEAGRSQSNELRDLITRFAPDVCYTSPLLRARQTTEILLDGTDIPCQIDDELREIDFGQWELKTFEQIAAENGAAVKRWVGFDQKFAFPDGESLGSFLARVRRVTRRLASDQAETVLAVTHGGIIRSMICRLLGIRPRNYLLFDVHYATCAVLEIFDNNGVLAGLNLRNWEEK